MKLKQPSKDAASKIGMMVNREWAKNLVMGVIRMYEEQYDTLSPNVESMLVFVATELKRQNIYIIPEEKP